MSSLLIMSCSKTKKHLENVPAIELYDGQAYRVIRKRSPENLEILIISAKYGIIRSTDIVSYYDQVMTVTEAVKMKEHVEKVIRKTVWKRNSMRIFITLGFPYNLAVSEELIDFLDEGFNLQVASGPIGKRLHQLKEWLEAGK
jgi:hypothetical protein